MLSGLSLWVQSGHPDATSGASPVQWEQLPLPLSPGPRASLYPCQTLNWPRLGEGSEGQSSILLPTQGTARPQ